MDSILQALGEPPRHLVLRNFLDEDLVAELLDHARANQSAFYETTVGAKVVNPAVRISSAIRDLGPFRPKLEERLRGLLPELIAALGVGAFELSRIELELVAHGDGAFYGRHLDTFTGDPESRPFHERMISGVYYFNALPKAFSGGQLRLYSLSELAAQPGGSGNFIDIEPDHNTLAVFSSWAPHEVRAVSCPSGAFMDSRFAINCWLCRRKPVAQAAPSELQPQQ